MAAMNLIRMDGRTLILHAGRVAAAIWEGMSSQQRAADGVDFVAMRIVDMTLKRSTRR